MTTPVYMRDPPLRGTWRVWVDEAGDVQSEIQWEDEERQNLWHPHQPPEWVLSAFWKLVGGPAEHARGA